MTLEELINQRWTDLYKDLHSRTVAQGSSFSPIIEAFRGENLVAALFPSEVRLVHNAMNFSPAYGADLIVSCLDINFAFMREGEEATSDTGIAVVAMTPSVCEMTIFPYHVGSTREVWYFDPVSMNEQDAVVQGGGLYSAVMNGFERAKQFQEAVAQDAKDSELDDYERRVMVDVAVSKTLISMGIDVSLFSEPGSDELIQSAFDHDPPPPSFSPN